MRKFPLLLLMACASSLVCGCGAKSSTGSSQTQAAALPTSSTSSSTTGTGSPLVQTYVQTVVAACKQPAGTAGSCVTCHTSAGVEAAFPFADPNSQTAYNSGIISLGIVNVNNPTASLLLQYLTNGHCGNASCQVAQGSVIYQAFVTAAENFATAALSGGMATSAIPQITSTPSPIPSVTVVPIASVKATAAAPVPLPTNPPLLGATPLQLNIPLTAVNANAGTSSLQLSVSYTVTGTSAAGALLYLYNLSHPVLVNATANLTVTLSGFYLSTNGTIDLGNSLFSNPTLYSATAKAGTTQPLGSNAGLSSISLLAAPGSPLTLDVVSLVTAP